MFAGQVMENRNDSDRQYKLLLVEDDLVDAELLTAAQHIGHVPPLLSRCLRKTRSQRRLIGGAEVNNATIAVLTRIVASHSVYIDR